MLGRTRSRTIGWREAPGESGALGSMVTADLEVLRKEEQPKGARAGDNRLQVPEVRKDRGWPEL